MPMVARPREGDPPPSRSLLLRVVLVIVPVLALAPSCTSPERTAGAPALDLAHWTTSNDGAWRVGYRTDPAVPPLNEAFSMVVQVLPAAPPKGCSEQLELAVDARMPAHQHGMNQNPAVRRGTPGVFHVDGMLLHMPGAWELHFDVTCGAVTERAQFSLELE